MILVVLHRTAARNYLDAYEAAHGSRDPGAGWDASTGTPCPASRRSGGDGS